MPPPSILGQADCGGLCDKFISINTSDWLCNGRHDTYVLIHVGLVNGLRNESVFPNALFGINYSPVIRCIVLQRKVLRVFGVHH